LNDSTISNPKAKPDTTTTYIVTVTDVYGCTDTDSVMVAVDSLDITATTDLDTIGACASADSAQISVTINSGTVDSMYWNTSYGLNDSTISNPKAHPDTTTTYVVTVTDIYGCTDTSSVDIVVANEPVAAAEATDSTLCSGDTLQLFETGGDDVTWAWSGPNSFDSTTQNPSRPDVTDNDSGRYYVTVTDQYGCTDIDSVDITVYDTLNSGSITGEQTICEGGTPGEIKEDLPPSGGNISGADPYNFQWQWSNDQISWAAVTDSTRQEGLYPPGPLSDTTYYRRATFDECDTVYSDTIPINVNPVPAKKRTKHLIIRR
jgi:hypothetical protein